MVLVTSFSIWFTGARDTVFSVDNVWLIKKEGLVFSVDNVWLIKKEGLVFSLSSVFFLNLCKVTKWIKEEIIGISPYHIYIKVGILLIFIVALLIGNF